MEKYKQEYNKWMKNVKNEEKQILLSMTDQEIYDCFRCRIKFGTGGLRGLIGLGTNRMNNYTVSAASYGVCQYILKTFGNNGSVVIAYDSRHFSETFAQTAANIFSSFGIKVYIFSSIRPTPELSFAVRLYKCSAGIMITASHNPAKYNGYKVYGSDGGQITPKTASEILSETEKADIFSEYIPRTELISYIGDETDKAYADAVCEQGVNPIKKDNFKLVYTPLYGSGNKLMNQVLKKTGFKDIITVKEQENPDGNFPTISAPNPEEPDSFALAVETAKKYNADLILATDCDGDRLGAAVPKNNKYELLTGNQIGILLTEYILSSQKPPKNGAVVSTIVSTRMIDAIAEYYNIKCFKTLTGFKYIGEKINEFEKTGNYKFIFGFEESYGFLRGEYCRDKDAIIAGMLVAEMAVFYKNKGMSLFDALDALYEKYGGYYEKLQSITYSGADGTEKINAIMSLFRNSTPKKIGHEEVLSITDYTKPTNLPYSDVLCFKLKNDTEFILRPSGTEPKIKLYCLAKGKTYIDAVEKTKYVMNCVCDIINLAADNN